MDYLLKPIADEELAIALEKFQQFYSQKETENPDIQQLITTLTKKNTQFKQRFIAKKGDKSRSVPVTEIRFFYAEDKVVFFQTITEERFIIDESLDQIAPLLDPTFFFRLNRKFLVHIEAVQEWESYFHGRLAVQLEGCKGNPQFVSRDKAKVFQSWLGQ